MKKIWEVCEDTREKLGRELRQEEIVFLQWMHMRYLEEKQKENEIEHGVLSFSLTESSCS